MADRSVVVNLTAQVGQYTAAMGQATQSTDQLAAAQDQASQATDAAGTAASASGSHFSQLAASADENRDAWDKAGGALTKAGVGMVAALGATAKAAMDWETAWAGVTKTVDGSPEQMAALEDGLRGLAKTLPLTHTEIAGVAEAAGQLGVAREDVVGFTKTMIDLGVSTNLTAEEAATDIAQISNVMGTMSREGSMGVARFGSALVALGNDGASTEKEILSMAQRIAGAGATVGATEVEVLALSNTLASMGIRAELGGGVTTRVLLKMFTAVKEGGATLDAFATTAGMSADEFSKAYSQSPVEALNLVSQGLNRVNQEGGNVVSVMKDMGIKGTEEVQVMLSLANSGTLLADSLALGATSWEENTALVEEATKRYDTAESRIKIAWNNIKDAAISAGAVLLPVISNVADGISTLAGWFGKLPAPVQGALTVIGGLVGITALLAGGFLVLFPRVMDTIGAFNTLGVTGTGLTGGMKKLGLALGIAGVALAAAAALRDYNNSMEPAVASTGEMTQSLMAISKNKNAINEVFANIDPGSGGRVLADVNDIGDALAKLTSSGFNDSVGQFSNDILGVNNDFAKMEEAVNNVDSSLAGMVGSGNMEGAAAGFQAVAQSAAEQGISMDTLKERFPTYIESLRQAATNAGVVVEEADLMNWAMGETPQVMLDAAAATDGTATSAEALAAAEEEAAAASKEFAEAMAEIGLSTDGTIIALDKFTDALFASGLATMSSRDAAFAWEETLRGVGTQIAEVGYGVNATGTDFDKMTEAGKNANAVFQGLINEGLGVASTFGKDLSKSTADVNLQLQDTYSAGVEAAKGLGLGEDAAIALTREVMGIPPGVSIETWMSEQALMMSGMTGEAVREIPESVHIETSMDSAAFTVAGMTKASAEDVPDQVTIDSWMADAAFIEAIRTRAAAEGIPPDVAVASFMESAARNEADDTTSAVLRIPPGTSISSYMAEYARLEAERTAWAMWQIPQNIDVTVNIATFGEAAAHAAIGGVVGAALAAKAAAGGATGGRVSDLAEGYAGGGRVPGSRSADITKDNVLGMVNGRAFGLQGTEWIVNPRSSDTYDAELEAINDGSFPKGLLSAAPAAFGREYAAPAAVVDSPGAAPVANGDRTVIVKYMGPDIESLALAVARRLN